MEITQSAQTETLGSVVALPPTACKARYGVSYVRAVCSQAGVMFTETSPDEDYLAVDGVVMLPAANVSMQVKCSSQFKIKGGSATWTAKPEWREKWTKSKLPIYFVLVIIDVAQQSSWIIHDDSGTMHKAAAFWVRVDQLSEGADIKVPKNQRLTAETMTQWATDVESCFAPNERGA